MDFFLDSGAFSAFTKGVEINIDEYCDFIKEHSEIITHYSVLDVIGSAEGTLKNQQYMEDKGLKPVPCFHYNEDVKYLQHYIENYDYLALGGMVPVHTNDLIPWLDKIFSNYICDKEGYPKVKIHGFGLTTTVLMLRYPWYSVDSSTWVLASSYGEINVPRKRNGEWDWLQAPIRVTVSNNSPKKKQDDRHYDTFNKEKQNVIDEWLKFINLPFGKSIFNDEKETIEQEGVSNNYKYRDTANLLYFIELNKRISEYPRKFENKNVRGLFI